MAMPKKTKRFKAQDKKHAQAPLCAAAARLFLFAFFFFRGAPGGGGGGTTRSDLQGILC